MKNLVLSSLAGLLMSISAQAAQLPAACETVAWNLAKAATDVEDYAEIANVSSAKSGAYSALVKANDVAWFNMKFQYDADSKSCLILTLKADYR